MVIKQYKDAKGLWRLVQVPNEDSKPEHGIVLSVDVASELKTLPLETMPTPEQVVAFSNRLWENGIITPKDFRGAVFDKVVKAFRAMPGFAGEKGRQAGNFLVQQIRSKDNGN